MGKLEGGGSPPLRTLPPSVRQKVPPGTKNFLRVFFLNTHLWGLGSLPPPIPPLQAHLWGRGRLICGKRRPALEHSVTRTRSPPVFCRYGMRGLRAVVQNVEQLRQPTETKATAGTTEGMQCQPFTVSGLAHLAQTGQGRPVPVSCYISCSQVPEQSIVSFSAERFRLRGTPSLCCSQKCFVPTKRLACTVCSQTRLPSFRKPPASLDATPFRFLFLHPYS